METLELCVCRDARGRARAATAPAGVAREGMYLRLVGGAFLLVERVERLKSGISLPRAAEVLESVWEGDAQ